MYRPNNNQTSQTWEKFARLRNKIRFSWRWLLCFFAVVAAMKNMYTTRSIVQERAAPDLMFDIEPSLFEKDVLSNSSVAKLESDKLGNGTSITNVTLATGKIISEDKTKKSFSNSSYAYSFLIGGIKEDPPAYKGFLYNVLISVNLLRKLGSTADFWVWTQISPNSTLDELPPEDMRLLSALNIHVEQLEKPKDESFAHIVYEKFRPLQMTQYRRVMFLDADAIPLVNMDYLFHLSDPNAVGVPTILRPNLIMASRGEPCNAGMFILEPKDGAWEELQDVISKQHDDAVNLPYPHFDRDKGWGHSFRDAGDHWEGIKKNRTDWRFHAAHSDQGLMFYWTKYVKQDVSIVISNRIQNWISDGDNDGAMPKKIKEYKDVLAMYTSKRPHVWQHACDRKEKDNDQSNYQCFPPYRDLAHFSGESKPWQTGTKMNWYTHNTTNNINESHRLWFTELGELNAMLKMGLDIDNWDTTHMLQMKKSPLGYMAMFWDNAKKILGENSTLLHNDM